MSRGINKVILIGNLGQDPDIRFTAQGIAVANLSIATSESWKDAGGQKHENTQWHRVVVFGKLAEIAQQYLKKGSKVFLDGKLQNRKYQKNGQDRYITEIVVDSYRGQLQMLDSVGQSANARAEQQAEVYQYPAASANKYATASEGT